MNRKKLMFVLFVSLLIATLIIPIVAASKEYSGTTEVVSTESTGDSEETCLAVDSSGNIHIAWQDLTNYDGAGGDWDVFYKRYEVGVGWTTTEVVSTESTSTSYSPCLAVDSSGNIHIAWGDYTNYDGAGGDQDVFYKRYEVGVGWTTTEVVSTESTVFSMSLWLAVDSNNNVHIAWDDYTDYDGAGTDADIFYKRYEVGVGWTTTEVVSTESTGGSFSPCLAVDLNDNVHIAWSDYTDYGGAGTDRDVFYKRYEVGVGWTTIEVVSTESTSTSQYPSLAVDSSGNIHIAWDDWTDYGGAGTDRDVFYKRYEVGVGWTTIEVVSTESTGNSYRSCLAVDSSGNIHIAWNDATDYGGAGGDWDVFYNHACMHASPEEATQDLIDQVQAFNLQQGIENSLDKRLQAVQNALTALNVEQRNDAINKLNAFINEVEAQRDNKVTTEQADLLISEAQIIIDLING